MTNYARRRMFVYSIRRLYDLFVQLNFLCDIHSEYSVSFILGLFQEYRIKTQSFLCTPSSKLTIDMLISGICCVLQAYYCNTSGKNVLLLGNESGGLANRKYVI
jgi:hypothetical protein